MTAASSRQFGKVFDEIAADYDRHRPGYPEQLIGYVCQIANLEPRDRILEVGCGSGQLTGALAGRGLRVTAVEPGEKLIALAKQNTKGLDEVEFINARFEDAELAKRHYRAVFCASAFHWIDPDISWQKTAELLVPGGVLALLSYFGLREARTARDLELLLSAMTKVAPALAASWPRYYALDELLEGVRAREANISEAWSWLGSYDLVCSHAGRMFGNLQIAAMPNVMEQTADELIAVFRTLSSYSSLSQAQRNELEHEFLEVPNKLGRPIRSSAVAILITARTANS